MADNGPFFVDGRHVSAEECRALFPQGVLDDRQTRCLGLVAGETIVDIGCYSGAFTDAVARRFPTASVTGVDYDPENLRIARFLHPNRNFLRSSVYELALGDESVDCVTFQEVIEHLEGAASAIKEINRVLKVGGTFILTTPHPYYWRDMVAFFVREIANSLRSAKRLNTAIYFEEVEWNRHIYCWTPATLLTLLVTNGFEYVTHQYSADAGNVVERLALRAMSFLGPTQILKVRKTASAPDRLI